MKTQEDARRLRAWHNTRMADHQRRHERPRREWWAWCGALVEPAMDLGCGLYARPRCLAVDLAWGDVHADALHLPFAADTFASVVSSHLLEHVEPRALLREVRRVLRPGGHLYLEAPNLMGLSRMLRVWRTGLRDSRYPTGGRTFIGALVAGLWACRHAGRVVERAPILDVPFAGRDPDAVWWCNGWAALRLLADAGFRVCRVAGLLGHTFRLEARRER
jgi:SAM-dependent methyltransferase